MFSEFLDDPFSWNYAHCVKTNKFIVGYKTRLDTYLASRKITYLHKTTCYFVRIRSQLRDLCDKEKQQFI